VRRVLGYTTLGLTVFISWPLHIIAPLFGLFIIIVTFMDDGWVAGLLSILFVAIGLWLVEIVIGIIALPLAAISASLLGREVEQKPLVKKTKPKFPGSLWILPIFFGVIGGIIAAFIVDLKYKASWWELLVAGVIVTVLWFLIIALI